VHCLAAALSDPATRLKLAKSSQGCLWIASPASTSTPAAPKHPPLRQSSSGGSSTKVDAKYQSCSDSGLAQRGHWPRCRRAVRTADHSALSLRRSSACRRSLGRNAWVVQVAPSSSPKQTSRTALSAPQLKSWWVTELCGGLRHDVSLPGPGPRAEPWGGVSRSDEMPTWSRSPFPIGSAGLALWTRDRLVHSS